MKKTFYITTPIYYSSGKLHIGNSYTTVLCDTISRYKALKGYDTRYLTGMDEHGQKVETVAKEFNKTPQELVDYLANNTKDLWSLLEIDYSDFIRTTEKRHKNTAYSDYFSHCKNKHRRYCEGIQCRRSRLYIKTI